MFVISKCWHFKTIINMKKHLLLLLALLSLVACKSNKVLSDSEIENMVHEEFEGNVVIVKRNNCQTYALVYNKQKKTLQMPVNGLIYGIVNLKTGELVYQENLNDGSVEWLNDEFISVRVKSGMVMTDRDQNNKKLNYLINVKTLTKKYQ